MLQENIRQSREQQLNVIGSKADMEAIVSTVKKQISRSNSSLQSSGSQRFDGTTQLGDPSCYVPGEVLPIGKNVDACVTWLAQCSIHVKLSYTFNISKIILLFSPLISSITKYVDMLSLLYYHLNYKLIIFFHSNTVFS